MSDYVCKLNMLTIWRPNFCNTSFNESSTSYWDQPGAQKFLLKLSFCIPSKFLQNAFKDHKMNFWNSKTKFRYVPSKMLDCFFGNFISQQILAWKVWSIHQMKAKTPFNWLMQLEPIHCNYFGQKPVSSIKIN